MNLRSHPVRMAVLEKALTPGAHFVVVRGRKSNERNVCLHNGHNILPVILDMPVSAALASVQTMNGLLRLMTNNTTEERWDVDPTKSLIQSSGDSAESST